MINVIHLSICFFLLTIGHCLANQCQVNPFERGGPKRPRPAPIIRPAPPPPAPKPINPNIEFRGVFKYKGQWHFSLFNKSVNKGAWVMKGESFNDGNVEVEDYNPESDVLKLKGGVTRSLITSYNKILPVPSGLPVKKAIKKPKPIIPNRTPVISGSRPRTITVPPRVNLPPKK